MSGTASPERPPLEPPPPRREGRVAPSVLGPVRAPFRALAATIVPEAARLGEDGWRGLEATVERALARRPPSLRRQLRLLIRALQWAPLARWGRPFTRLRERHRVAFLERVQRSRLYPLRRGFWGLRTLVFMGYYLRPGAGQAIGYGATARGWAARREATDASPAREGGHTP